MAGWTGSDDAESLASLERAVDLGCNFFDTAWAYGDGHSERLLGRLVRATSRTRRSTSRPRSRRRICKWPVAARLHARRVLPARPHPRVRREEPGEPRPAADRPAPVPRLGGRLGRRRPLATGMDDLKRAGPGPGRRRQRQPLGAGERRRDAADRADRRRAGHLQHLRPGPRGRALPALPRAEHRRDRARAVRRGDADGHADAGEPLARGRLAEHATSSPRTSRPSVERAEALRPLCPAADDARAGPALDPGRPDGLDDHPRHAQAAATSRRTSPPATAGPLARPALGLRAHRWDRAPKLVAVRRLNSARPDSLMVA